MNTVSLTGILQRFEDKGSWVKGSIRVAGSVKNKETGKYDSHFFNFKAFNKTAELLQRFHSDREGKPFAITGELNQERWEDKEGNKRESYVIIVRNADLPPFDDSKPAASNQSRPASGFGADPFSNNGRNDVPFDLSESELPF